MNKTLLFSSYGNDHAPSKEKQVRREHCGLSRVEIAATTPERPMTQLMHTIWILLDGMRRSKLASQQSFYRRIENTNMNEQRVRSNIAETIATKHKRGLYVSRNPGSTSLR